MENVHHKYPPYWCLSGGPSLVTCVRAATGITQDYRTVSTPDWCLRIVIMIMIMYLSGGGARCDRWGSEWRALRRGWSARMWWARRKCCKSSRLPTSAQAPATTSPAAASPKAASARPRVSASSAPAPWYAAHSRHGYCFERHDSSADLLNGTMSLVLAA